MNEVAETIARGVCPSCTWRGDVELVNGVCPQCNTDWWKLSPDNMESMSNENLVSQLFVLGWCDCSAHVNGDMQRAAQIEADGQKVQAELLRRLSRPLGRTPKERTL